MSNYFDIKFYDERYGNPDVTLDYPTYKYVHTYSNSYGLIESTLTNIKLGISNEDNLQLLIKHIDNESYDSEEKMIVHLPNIIYAQKKELHK